MSELPFCLSGYECLPRQMCMICIILLQIIRILWILPIVIWGVSEYYIYITQERKEKLANLRNTRR